MLTNHCGLGSSSRFVFTLALTLTLAASVSGCGRRARTGGGSGFDGGGGGGSDGGGGGGFDSGTPITGGVVEEALAASQRLASDMCPCAVDQGLATSVAECMAMATPDPACARSVYTSMRSTELDTALRCGVTQSDAARACLTTMGCSALIDCLGGDSMCPASAALEDYQAGVSDCSGGIMPGTCTVASMGSSVGTSVFSGVTSGASAQTGGCGGGSAPDAVHQWTAPSSGIFTIDTIGSGFDTVLYVRSGTCTGTEVACDDDGGGSGSTSLVTIEATTGQQLFIVVDGFSSYMGSYVVNIAFGATPP